MASVSVSAGFEAGPAAATLPCGLTFGLPKFALTFGFVLPSIEFPPALPSFPFSFSLSCDLSSPIKINSKPLVSGGGRQSNALPEPSLSETA